MSLNLASRPFVNQRPLRRAGITLWVLVGILTLVNGFFYLDYFRGSGRQTRERSLELERQIRAEKGRIESLEMELGRFDPEGQAEHVIFLNERIAERTFGWGHLFDRMADVLPLRVRLTYLIPQRRDEGRRKSSMDGTVSLSLKGRAESDDDLYELVDKLWAHPAFEKPDLNNEHLKDGTIIFQLSVIYVPDAPNPTPIVEEDQAVDEGQNGEEAETEATEDSEAEGVAS